jgi:hypothetical protein
MKRYNGLPKRGKRPDYYRLRVSGPDILISRMKIETGGQTSRPYFTADERVLLSLDIYDPSSLNNIRNWLQDI